VRLQSHNPPGVLSIVALDLQRWERPDGIIPLRNLLLVSIAAQYGSDIALAATAGDRVLDKTPEFAERAGELLSWLWQPQHWTGGKRVTVRLPVKHLSKAALVRAAVAAGADPARIAGDTFSCYTPTSEGAECGACKPCARKWVALLAADCAPSTDAREYVREHYLSAIEAGTWDRGDAERDDVLHALNLARSLRARS